MLFISGQFVCLIFPNVAIVPHRPPLMQAEIFPVRLRTGQLAFFQSLINTGLQPGVRRHGLNEAVSTAWLNSGTASWQRNG
jgi:hypothetical protein